MRKEEFIQTLRTKLLGLPQEELEKSLSYYRESIEDRIEDGASEEEAVAAIGSVEEAAAQILSVVPLQRIVREKMRPRRKLRAWEITLLVLGAPAWIPLLLSAFLLLLSAYLVVWCIVGAVYCVELSFAMLAVFGVVGLVYFSVQGSSAQGWIFFGAGLVFAGLTIFGFFLCNALVKGAVWLTKKIGLGVKRMFVGKEYSA